MDEKPRRQSNYRWDALGPPSHRPRDRCHPQRRDLLAVVIARYSSTGVSRIQPIRPVSGIAAPSYATHPADLPVHLTSRSTLPARAGHRVAERRGTLVLGRNPAHAGDVMSCRARPSAPANRAGSR